MSQNEPQWGVRLRIDRFREEQGITEPAPWDGVQYIPAWVMGGVERLFFTIVVALNVAGAIVAMMAWLALKMASDWNRPGSQTAADPVLSGVGGGRRPLLLCRACAAAWCRCSSPW